MKPIEMDIQIRWAQPDDVQSALPLIYSSGPHEFDYVFHTDKKTTQEYLSFAFLATFGGQSHRSFFVATHDGLVIGISAFYSGKDNLWRNAGNFRSLLSFYGPRQMMKVIQRGLRMESILPPPEADSGFISQLGVRENYRGKGVGTALILYMIERSRVLGLRICSLDVAVSNPHAQQLYERLGFKVVQENKWKYAGDLNDHIPDQRRMHLTLQPDESWK